MAEIQNVTGTAFIVAEMRASENAEANPLYRDPIVPLFLSDETRTAAERFSAVFPPIKKVIKLRTRYFDDRLDSNFILAVDSEPLESAIHEHYLCTVKSAAG